MSLKNLNASNKNLNKLNKSKINHKITKIYKKFESALELEEKFAVAVSGGPDSLALAYLSKNYAQKKKVQVKYFLVDHKLRDDSTNEARNIKDLLNKHKIKVEILTWRGPKPHSNIQSSARKARYKLLLEKCKKLGIRNILLGHHLDDLLENFFIRILRGSGLRGLVSFDKKTVNDNINIFRPLIDLEKKDLIYITQKIFGSYVSDPSNFNELFKRTRIRKFLLNLENEGLDKKKFLSTLKNLKTSDEAIRFNVRKNLIKNASFLKTKKTVILKSEFFDNSYEIVFRSLSECIKMIGGYYHFVRGKKLDKLISSLNNKSQFKRSLGGCIIKKIDQTVMISREN
tara:strand:+ start:1145 stop:2173 length:1029 start_codon:yes stop_codon:yes gene_type:complete